MPHYALHFIRARKAPQPRSKPRLGAALIMGAAICGLHYTGMAAASFAVGSVCISTPLDVDPAWLAGMVGGGASWC